MAVHRQVDMNPPPASWARRGIAQANPHTLMVMVEKESASGETEAHPTKSKAASPPLVELSNAMVALHREHFGRGPAAARSVIADGIAICVLKDVFTRVERTLIEAGRLDHVRTTRLLHQQMLEQKYRTTVEKILGRPVTAFLSQVHFEPDVAVEVFLLDDG